MFLVEKPIVKEMSGNVYKPVVEKDFLTVSDLDFPTSSGPDLDFSHCQWFWFRFSQGQFLNEYLPQIKNAATGRSAGNILRISPVLIWSTRSDSMSSLWEIWIYKPNMINQIDKSTEISPNAYFLVG